MKLTLVEIENFRCFERLRVPLEADVTAIIGINAAGKTALLDAIALALVPLLEGTPLRSPPGTLFPGPPHRAAAGVNLSLDDSPVHPNTEKKSATEICKLLIRASAPPSEGIGVELEWAVEWKYGAVETLGGAPPDARWLHPPGLGPASTGLCVDSGQCFQVPALAYYRDSRTCPADPKRPDGLVLEAESAPAFFRAFDAAADYPAAERWFFARENEELREQRAQKDFDFALPDLAAIRRALAGMLDGIDRVYSVEHPPRLKADKRDASGRVLSLELSQLSAGQRNLLALTLDFARRLSLAHPAWDDPLAAPGILLIDEIELNLHPRWQQTVIPHLRRVFTNTQIIVATHSPQVLSTLERRQIRVLRDGKLFVPGVQTYGADSARVQRLVMDTDSRPPDNTFVERLSAVFEAIGEQQLEEADKLLGALEAERGSDDPDLTDARMQIENRKWEAEIGL